MAVSKVLERRGYSVQTVARGEQAVEACGADESIDLVLMDIDLGPGMTGLEAAERIRSSRDLPVVFLSSHTEAGIVERARTISPYGYLRKTATEDEMVWTVQQALQRSGKNDSNALARHEVLLRELRHRASNSLAIIGALVRIEVEDSADENVRRALLEVEGRIHTVAELYTLLTEGADAEVHLDDYLSSICTRIDEAYDARQSVSLELLLRPVVVETRRASTIGLILNEVLTNAYKYAFAGRERGVIRIELAGRDGRISLTVHDDGVGVRCAGGLPQDAGVGVRLVEALAEDLSATTRWEDADGVRFQLDCHV